jgi:hypothetical protein
MARDPDKLAASFEIGNTGGFLSGFLAEEDVLDRSGLWRLGVWGVASLGAVILAVYANQSSITLRRDQVAAVDLGRQTQQIQTVAKESQNETRRLASAIETLNGDRDRLYSRLSALEQGLDSVTGAIAKQKTAAATSPAATAVPTPPAAVVATAEPTPAAQSSNAGPVVSPVSTTAAKAAEKPPAGDAAPAPAPAVVASIAPKSSSPTGESAPVIASTPAAAAMVATSVPPAVPASGNSSAPTAAVEPATTRSNEPEKPAKSIFAAALPEVVASVAVDDKAEADMSEVAAPKLPVQRTEFGVDVGGANSVGGLRALWRGLLKSRSNAALTALRPIIVVKEGRNGLGMQLRLVAGPLDDAAGAAKICAGLIENERSCETTVFDGQRLAMNSEEAAMAANPAPTKPTGERHFTRRRSAPKRVAAQDPPKPDPPPSTLSTFFRR